MLFLIVQSTRICKRDYVEIYFYLNFGEYATRARICEHFAIIKYEKTPQFSSFLYHSEQQFP